MSDRLTLTQPVYMPVQGQWVIVYGGSVLDLPSAAVTHTSLLCLPNAPRCHGAGQRPAPHICSRCVNSAALSSYSSTATGSSAGASNS